MMGMPDAGPTGCREHAVPIVRAPSQGCIASPYVGDTCFLMLKPHRNNTSSSSLLPAPSLEGGLERALKSDEGEDIRWACLRLFCMQLIETP